jgi:hypothetical protein
MKQYIIFTGNNTFQKVQAEDYNDAYAKVNGYLGAVSSTWKSLYSKYYKLHSKLKKYDVEYIREQIETFLDYPYTTINGEFISIDDVLNLDYVYTTQDGDEFVIAIQYLNDEQMYKLVTYMNKIIEIL